MEIQEVVKMGLSTWFIIFGGALTLFGGFMATREASNDKGEIVQLTKENNNLTKYGLDFITGGKSYPYISNRFRTPSGAWPHDKIDLSIKIDGDIPVYDLSITVLEVFLTKKEKDSTSWKTKLISEKQIGTLGRTLHNNHLARVTLNKDSIRHFFFSLRARNGEVNQEIIYVYNKEKEQWEWATHAVRNKLGKDQDEFLAVTLFTKQSDYYNNESYPWYTLSILSDSKHTKN